MLSPFVLIEVSIDQLSLVIEIVPIHKHSVYSKIIEKCIL